MLFYIGKLPCQVTLNCLCVNILAPVSTVSLIKTVYSREHGETSVRREGGRGSVIELTKQSDPYPNGKHVKGSLLWYKDTPKTSYKT